MSGKQTNGLPDVNNGVQLLPSPIERATKNKEERKFGVPATSLVR